MHPYKLLHAYHQQATIKSKAYAWSEVFFRNMHKCLTYPLILLSAINTVLSGFHAEWYIVMGVSFSTLVLAGFDRAIDPKDKEHKACQIKVEMDEIATNIKQYIMANHRTDEQIKQYTEIIHQQITIWNSIAPPIRECYITKATRECAERTRAHKTEYKHSGSSSVFENFV